jgi:hypothetical protein
MNAEVRARDKYPHRGRHPGRLKSPRVLPYQTYQRQLGICHERGENRDDTDH